MTSAEPEPTADAAADAADAAEPVSGAAGSALWPSVIGYVLLRLLLTAVIAAALLGISVLVTLDMPVLVAIMLAIVLQLPLAWILLPKQRDRAASAMAVSAGRRRRVHEDLRSALAGNTQVSPDEEQG
ncbi:MAG: DUF4229 domain-containing protein [Nakamurella sp.]